MLLQNPQLAYALLQAQVVMRIVDPEIALVSDADLRIRKSDAFCYFYLPQGQDNEFIYLSQLSSELV